MNLRRRRTSPAMLIAALLAVAITTFWQSRTATTPTPVPPPAGSANTPAVPTRASSPAATATPEATDALPERDALRRITRSEDEREALEATLVLIERGGPFPYPQKDGSTFSNREGHLPARPRGYYREYTVPTRGASNRGARRVVTGSDGERWYTRDHYRTFTRIDAGDPVR